VKPFNNSLKQLSIFQGYRKIANKDLRDRKVTEKIIKLDDKRNYPVIQKMPIIFKHPPRSLDFLPTAAIKSIMLKDKSWWWLLQSAME
jgi:hypothetical protein